MALERCDFAPVVLFVYNRPWHTRQTVEALRKNAGAEDSDLIVFSDGPRDGVSEEQVHEVRRYLRTVEGFRSIRIVERDTNLGLADSIVSGVTEVVNEYGRVIVMEDDLVTSESFLSFMNKSLVFYALKEKVWHISGWNYPIDPTGLPDTFLWRVMNCWGWATWDDRWRHFEKNTDKVLKSFSRQDIFEFNLDGHMNFWRQVICNKKGKINSWAIYWYTTIFKNEGLCLNPSFSYVLNIGHDGSGIHCNQNELSQSIKLNQNRMPRFPYNLDENGYVVALAKEYFFNNFSLLQRFLFFVHCVLRP